MHKKALFVVSCIQAKLFTEWKITFNISTMSYFCMKKFIFIPDYLMRALLISFQKILKYVFFSNNKNIP